MVRDSNSNLSLCLSRFSSQSLKICFFEEEFLKIMIKLCLCLRNFRYADSKINSKFLYEKTCRKKKLRLDYELELLVATIIDKTLVNN
ncbi:hypothetical protein KFK09_008374 [Dendrobium nobile]|uniref:Uncharacterized protein n=1 Tax=Dendrobium nobile TaxID=94219 RepID=A0A8T3BMJ5_DENNO|nr:hypothetical protein KFK09_008374 [Dendrobium nobile]